MAVKTLEDRRKIAEALARSSVVGWDAHSSWNTQSLSFGDQAHLFTVMRARTAQCIEREQPLIVKLYKDESKEDRAAFRREVDCLQILHDCLHGTIHEGWKVYSPQVIMASDELLGLVISEVPGIPLLRYLQSEPVSVPELKSIASAILSALRVIWTHDAMYGDLNLKNILCDPKAGTLAFIDPGMPLDYYCCDQVPTNWAPMSRDLGYLLYSVTVSVKRTLVNPQARRRQELIVYFTLHQFVESLGSAFQRQSFLEELQQCCAVHLQRLDCSWSPAGIWRRIVKYLSRIRVGRMVGRLSSPCFNETQ